MRKTNRRTKICLAAAFLIASIGSTAQAAAIPTTYPPVALNGNALDLGYRALYNLDFPGAHAQFAAWMRANPGDPLGAASDAAASLFGEFNRLGIIDVQLFADDSRFNSRNRLSPDPAVRKAFDDRAAQADALADAALKRNPRDANALYAKTLVCGMRSDYALMIDDRNLDALSWSKKASALSHQTLAADQALVDANLASGVENYMLSLKLAPIRWILSWTGAGTDREEGIRLLELTATRGHYLAPFARMMLAVAALRDHQPQQARAILTALSQEFPGNRLYAYERDRIR
jgi:hypothetical protein